MGNVKELFSLLDTARGSCTFHVNSWNMMLCHWRDTTDVKAITTVKFPGEGSDEVLRWKGERGDMQQIVLRRPEIIARYNQGGAGKDFFSRIG
jgi:hypothetical protein